MPVLGLFRIFAVHDIARNLQDPVCRALPFFHTLTGCDTTSSFYQVWKKTAWEAWKAMPEMTAVFEEIGDGAYITDISDNSNKENFKKIQRFIIVMYSRSSSHTEVNKARHALFAAGRAIESIPPTEAALEQHMKRATLQCSIWRQSLQRDPTRPSPDKWGWEKNQKGYWAPVWSLLPVVSAALQQLIRCGCKKRCAGNCTCCQYDFKCTPLCACWTPGCSRLWCQCFQSFT